MEYKEATEWLYRQLPMFSRTGAAAYKPGLERSEALAAHFGNPERRLKAIHVAGTNGKGSVSNLIAATLQSQGYRTALYTSPHLVDFRERMRIDGEMIPREEVTDFVERWLAGDYKGDSPSFFELTMMMAFDWFAAENVDIAVVETGMGGRLDSTNIITPLMSVITNISNDHKQFLGDTLSQIASEKAGIIKNGIPVVIGEAEGEVESVFRRKAEETGAPLREAYRETDTEANSRLATPLSGLYQKKNVNTARVALEELRRIGVEISDECMIRGFARVIDNTHLSGRWMKLEENPTVICDTGHNEAGIMSNVRQLNDMRAEIRGRLHVVIGFVADKDLDHILGLFGNLPADTIFYITQASVPRAMERHELLERFRNTNPVFTTGLCDTPAAAYTLAREQAASDDIIFIGGSTFVVADFLASRANNQK